MIIRLCLLPGGRELEDGEVLAALRRAPAGGARPEPLTLALVRLEYVDADVPTAWQLLRASEDGAARTLRGLLRLPLWPDYSAESGKRLGAASPGTSPLILACQAGRLDAARALCEAGADLDRARPAGGTALLLSCGSGHAGVADLLLEAGADADRAQPDGATPLILASAHGHLAVARLLCRAGADGDAARLDGATALMLAAAGGHWEVARLLCKHKADVDRLRRDGASALMLASQAGHLEVAHLLCKAGADKDRARLDGATALMAASQFGHQDRMNIISYSVTHDFAMCRTAATKTMPLSHYVHASPGSGAPALQGRGGQGPDGVGRHHGLVDGV